MHTDTAGHPTGVTGRNYGAGTTGGGRTEGGACGLIHIGCTGMQVTQAAHVALLINI